MIFDTKILTFLAQHHKVQVGSTSNIWCHFLNTKYSLTSMIDVCTILQTFNVMYAPTEYLTLKLKAGMWHASP